MIDVVAKRVRTLDFYLLIAGSGVCVCARKFSSKTLYCCKYFVKIVASDFSEAAVTLFTRSGAPITVQTCDKLETTPRICIVFSLKVSNLEVRYTRIICDRKLI